MSTLREKYDSAEGLRKELDDLPSSNDRVYQESLLSAIAAYRECADLIERMSLFSANESLEEVATGEMRYILVDHYLALLTLQDHSADREAVLGSSRSLLLRFLTLCDAYGLLSPSDRAAFKPDGSPATSLSPDPATRRSEKIANYRKEKDLQANIDRLARDPSCLDDEETRKLHSASISLCILQSIQQLGTIALELQVRSEAPKPADVGAPQADERARDRDVPGFSERLDTIPPNIKGGPLLSQDGKPLRPFTLLGDRSQLKRDVFKSGHNLPTMTIDEYLEEERRRGGIIEGGGEASGLKPEPDEDDYEKADIETMKAREWDEFKEANPRGSGNTINRG